MEKKEKLTAIIPVKNEAHNIRDVIESVSFADEIMVVDSYSTDDTLKIAKEYTSFILQRDFNYAASQKNWAIPQATHEWILLVDADERVTPDLKEEVIHILKNPPQKTVAFWIGRVNHFMGQQIKYSGWQNDKVIRLFRKSKCKYQDKLVHEEIIADGEVGFLKNKLLHYTYRSIDKHVEKLNKYAAWQAEENSAKTGKLTPYHFILKPFWRFFKHFIVQGGFRDGLPGFVISFLRAYSMLIRYIKIWLFRKGLK